MKGRRDGELLSLGVNERIVVSLADIVCRSLATVRRCRVEMR